MIKYILTSVLLVLSHLYLKAQVVNVSNSTQLQNALNAATPGQTIVLADGVYIRSGGFYVNADINGTPSQPITVLGNAKTIISSNNLNTGYGFALKGNDYWVLDGFTVYNSKKGIVTDSSHHNVIKNIKVNKIGDEGIHLRAYSSFNTVDNCFVDSCGLVSAGTGEGIYVGSAVSNWPTYTGGNPDTCNYNSIINNSFGDHISSENIDIKEGTKGGLIYNNAFNGAGLNGQNSADSWIDIKGNYYRIECNTGVNTILDGFQTHINYVGYGDYNSFSNNNLTVGAGGYAIKIQTTGSNGTAPNNMVCSNNSVTGGANGMTNITTQTCSGTCGLITPTIVFDNLTKTYGDGVFDMTTVSNSSGAMTYSITSGNSFASIDGSTGKVTILGAGTVIIQVSQVAFGSYAAATKTATLTINKASLTATADNKSRSYNAANPSFTISYVGFVNGESAAIITEPTASTIGNGSSNAGTYPITLSGGSAANYTITLVNGVLTVTKATPTLTYTGLTSGTVGDVIALSVATNSSGVIAYGLSNETGSATLIGNQLTLTSGGNISITINVASDGNYAATSFTQTITIVNVTSVVDVMNCRIKVYPSITDNLAIIEIKDLNLDGGVIIISDTKGVEKVRMNYWGETEIRLGVSSWPAGVYVVKLQTESGEQVVKFVKQ